MAFVAPLSLTSFLPPCQSTSSLQSRPVALRRSLRHRRCTLRTAKRHTIRCENVRSTDAMEFFRHREGEWESWRVTHHLAFRRSEAGDSLISMKCLDPTDERIVSLCRDWDVDPSDAQGGCYVTWRATMAWDQEGENHEGSTVFALVPEKDDIRRGRILRDRGYAEIVPIAGKYFMDENDDLNLITPYEGGEVKEKFAFDGLHVVNRNSTVQRFGGFSTATFATERRVGQNVIYNEEEGDVNMKDVETILNDLAFSPVGGAVAEPQESKLVGAGRWSTPVTGKPSTNSAFGSGFSAPIRKNVAEKPSVNRTEETNDDGKKEEGLSEVVLRAAEAAGIDLSKIPPSMRDDFVASFDNSQ